MVGCCQQAVQQSQQNDEAAFTPHALHLDWDALHAMPPPQQVSH